MRAVRKPTAAQPFDLGRLQDDLEWRQQQYREMIESSVQGICVNSGGTPLFVNQAYARILGYDSPEQILALGTLDAIIAPHDLERLKSRREARMRGEQAPGRYEFDAVRKDGSRITVETILSTINWEGQRAIQHTIFDITELKNSQEQLRKSEQCYRGLIENSLQGILIRTRERRVLANAAYAEIFGYDSVEEILALDKPYSLLAPHERKRVRGYDDARFRGEAAPAQFEVQAIRRDGTPIWLSEFDRLMTWQGEPAVQITYVDITEKKRSEEKLKDSEARYRELVEGSVQGISIRGSRRRLLVNESYARMLGYDSVEEVMAEKPPHRIACKHEQPRMIALHVSLRRGEQAPIQYVFEGKRKDGSKIWFNAISRAINWQGERAVQTTSMDITEQKHSEEELRESEKLYRDLIEGSVQGIMIRGYNNVLFTNDALVRLFGYESVREIKRLKNFRTLAAPHERARLLEYGKARLRGKAAPTHYEMEGVKKDGSRIWLSVVARVIQWKGQPAIQTAVTDITDKKRTQDELVARKLESVGALAKGIAGEFNTIFNTMLSSISLAKMESYAMGFDRISEILTDAEQTSDKAKDLIQQLLVLSRGGSPAKERISVEEIIRDSLPFSGRGKVVPLKRDNVEFKLVLPGNLHPVSADRVQMTHVFSSLIGNGIRSMPFGGTLAVSAENVEIKPGARGIHLQPGQYVKTSIKDQGQGIPQSSLGNLFDPYFSTDANGGGLELSSAFSVVKAHEGTITVHSTIGKGTRLAVFLPAII